MNKYGEAVTPLRQVERLGADYANLREQRHLRRCHAEGTRETVRVQFDLDAGDGGNVTNYGGLNHET